ncbi:hypothetical protein DLAC_07837 [Tieghemostelium lacteum]|uniref:Glycosyltransferase 2-like domain-containing protein n=1 Tax=Tieghemostelium lacteum TaxID=361077 RepID=A0A151ZAJ5_TIELA|nr:hypothetical protein DLAC_07837 [Tieghemostelium lacteum]|eukprot:KYQ90956.1 hypothetical protein DLAC_07837 [Tieghemostelium lacteum]
MTSTELLSVSTNVKLQFKNPDNLNESILEFPLSYDILDNKLQITNQITTLPCQLRFTNLYNDIITNQNGVKKRDFKLPMVSVCICMKNAQNFINETLFSVICQTYNGPLEVSIFDHSSTDKSIEMIKEWVPLFKVFSIGLLLNGDGLSENDRLSIYDNEYKTILESISECDRLDRSDKGGFGVGYSRNRSIIQSNGQYLCLLDSDDIMYCERVEMQYLEALEKGKNVLIGSNFIRIPEGSSHRYSQWCNSLTNQQLLWHQFREIPIIQPTWFMSRSLYNRIGGYQESFPSGNPKNNEYIHLLGTNNNANQYKHKNQEKHMQMEKERQDKVLANSPPPHIPEDLIFFHQHLNYQDALLSKVHQPLVLYRYHSNNQSNQIHRLILMKVRIQYLESRILSKWDKFSIWGAGRDGKKFFTMLSDSSKSKVTSFCDVDDQKVGTTYNAAYTPYKIPIIHFSQVKPPFIICVALDRSNGEFEANLQSLQLKESIDYYHFN